MEKSPIIRIPWPDPEIWEPSQTLPEIGYSPEDFVKFREEVCRKIGLPTLREVTEVLGLEPVLIKEYIEAVARGLRYSRNGIQLKDTTEGQRKYHQHLFHIMYEVPLDDVPLYVNDDSDFLPVVNWRLDIAK
jgi:hypothetical protein